jgi:hypothetical protein
MTVATMVHAAWFGTAAPALRNTDFVHHPGMRTALSHHAPDALATARSGHVHFQLHALVAHLPTAVALGVAAGGANVAVAREERELEAFLEERAKAEPAPWAQASLGLTMVRQERAWPDL